MGWEKRCERERWAHRIVCSLPYTTHDEGSDFVKFGTMSQLVHALSKRGLRNLHHKAKLEEQAVSVPKTSCMRTQLANNQSLLFANGFGDGFQ